MKSNKAIRLRDADSEMFANSHPTNIPLSQELRVPKESSRRGNKGPKNGFLACLWTKVRRVLARANVIKLEDWREHGDRRVWRLREESKKKGKNRKASLFRLRFPVGTTRQISNLNVYLSFLPKCECDHRCTTIFFFGKWPLEAERQYGTIPTNHNGTHLNLPAKLV